MEFRGSRNQVNKEPQHRINESIRAAQVRVVGENIEPGVYPLREALAMAEAAGMDLVEISPNAEPPVCRIIDYSKFPVSYTHLDVYKRQPKYFHLPDGLPVQN